jgi:hypothetical protein
MRTESTVLAAVLLLALVVSGCSGGGGGTEGSGTVATQDRPVPAFDSIDFSSVGTVTVEQTGTDSLQVQADDNIAPLLTSEVEGTTLKLGVQPGATIGRADITYRITVRQLGGVVLSGAGSVNATGIDGPSLALANSGAGSLTVTGRTDRLNVDLVGLGSVDTRGLTAQDVDVSVGGAGTATVNAARTLSARVTGVGDIVYLGNPAVTQEVTGLGTVGRG